MMNRTSWAMRVCDPPSCCRGLSGRTDASTSRVSPYRHPAVASTPTGFCATPRAVAHSYRYALSIGNLAHQALHRTHRDPAEKSHMERGASLRVDPIPARRAVYYRLRAGRMAARPHITPRHRPRVIARKPKAHGRLRHDTNPPRGGNTNNDTSVQRAARAGRAWSAAPRVRTRVRTNRWRTPTRDGDKESENETTATVGPRHDGMCVHPRVTAADRAGLEVVRLVRGVPVGARPGVLTVCPERRLRRSASETGRSVTADA